MNQEVTSSIHDEIETIREVRELLKLLSQARIPELVKGIAKGDLIILKKDKAMCPVCGYKFESPFSEDKP